MHLDHVSRTFYNPRTDESFTSPQTNFADLLFPEQGRQSLVREVPPLSACLPEHLPILGIKLVRTGSVRCAGHGHIHSPKDAAAIAWECLKHSDREQVLSILVDTKNGVVGVNVVSVGDLSSSVVHPREVFKAAILANAASVILAHNHPSGDPTPSPEDIAVTRRIAEAGQILGIELLDHVIVGDRERFVSLKNQGHF